MKTQNKVRIDAAEWESLRLETEREKQVRHKKDHHDSDAWAYELYGDAHAEIQTERGRLKKEARRLKNFRKTLEKQKDELRHDRDEFLRRKAADESERQSLIKLQRKEMEETRARLKREREQFAVEKRKHSKMKLLRRKSIFERERLRRKSKDLDRESRDLRDQQKKLKQEMLALNQEKQQFAEKQAAMDSERETLMKAVQVEHDKLQREREQLERESGENEEVVPSILVKQVKQHVGKNEKNQKIVQEVEEVNPEPVRDQKLSAKDLDQDLDQRKQIDRIRNLRAELEGKMRTLEVERDTILHVAESKRKQFKLTQQTQGAELRQQLTEQLRALVKQNSRDSRF